MTSQLQSPLIYVPTKRADPIDFGPSFREYIRNVYCEDPQKYATEIGTINKLRQDIQGAGKDMTGRDILYRYYGQLEMLEMRFPIDEHHVKVQFTWYSIAYVRQDAFTDKQVSQYSVAFEKACVIFNLGATCSAIASLQNRADPNGQKIAFNYFQAAAGLFAFINENFLHPPSLDMSRDSIATLTDLCLAQAQESFIEKLIVDKKKGAMIAKLAAHVTQVYSTVIEGLLNDNLSGQFDVSWLELIQVKAKYFHGLAHLHRAIQLEGEGKYGECVGYYNQADKSAKEAIKLSESFAKRFATFTLNSMANATSSSAAGQTMTVASALTEMTKNLAGLAAEGKRIASKDNEVIYHEAVPETLAPIEKLNAVKNLSFSELFANGKADTLKIIGSDVFAKLIPMSVHESASVYSDQKDQLLRAQDEKVQTADVEYSSVFESLDIVSTLDKMKKLARGDDSLDDHYSLPAEVKSWCMEIRREEVDSNGTATSELVNIVESMKNSIRESLNDCSLKLDKEQHECEQLRLKHGPRWTLEPSGPLTGKLRKDIKEHRDTLEQAILTDQGMMNKLKDCKPEIDMMKNSLVELESIFSESISMAGKPQQSNTVNLLDAPQENTSMGGLGEQVLYEKLDGAISKLRDLKKERTAIIEGLRDKIKNEDISQALIANKGKEKQVYDAELAKFNVYQNKLHANITTQSQLLNELQLDFNRLKASSRATKVLQMRDKLKKDLVLNWNRGYEAWKEVRSGLKRGVEFYTELADATKRIEQQVQSFLGMRNEQKNALVKSLEAMQAASGQQALKEQLQKLSLQATSPQQQQQPQSMGYQPSPTSFPPLQYSSTPAYPPSQPQQQYTVAPSQYPAPVQQYTPPSQSNPQYPPVQPHQPPQHYPPANQTQQYTPPSQPQYGYPPSGYNQQQQQPGTGYPSYPPPQATQSGPYQQYPPAQYAPPPQQQSYGYPPSQPPIPPKVTGPSQPGPYMQSHPQGYSAPQQPYQQPPQGYPPYQGYPRQ